MKWVLIFSRYLFLLLQSSANSCSIAADTRSKPNTTTLSKKKTTWLSTEYFRVTQIIILVLKNYKLLWHVDWKVVNRVLSSFRLFVVCILPQQTVPSSPSLQCFGSGRWEIINKSEWRLHMKYMWLAPLALYESSLWHLESLQEFYKKMLQQLFFFNILICKNHFII